MKQLIFTLAVLLLSSSLTAQSQRPAYMTGKLYLKLHNHLSPTLLPVFSSPAGLAEWKQHPNPEIASLGVLLEAHGAYAISRPFLRLSDALDRTFELSFSDGAATLDLMRSLKASSLLEYAEQVPIHYTGKTQFSPNDYNSSQQWFLNAINASGAWDVSRGSSDVVIAIVDDQVQIDHPDLAANIWVNPGEIAGNGIDDDANGYIDDVHGWDVADNDADVFTETFLAASHGTHVAGCASAVSDNGTGVAGIGFSCKIMVCKSTSDNNNDNPPTINNGYGGIAYAIANGADVINMSWGGPGGASQTGQNLIDAGWNKGVMIVAAAGNDDTDDADVMFYPAAFNHVLNVGSTASTNQKSWFSNYGTTIDVMTPGSNIRSTYPLNSYANMDGTSMASPITAGLCGLMKAANPCLTNADIEFYLKQTCSPINSTLFTQGKLGAGLVNAQAALQAVQVASPMPSFSFTPSGACSNKVQFTYTGTLSTCPDFLEWSVSDSNGNVIAVSNDRNPLLQFPSGTGTYEVTLFAQNTAGTNMVTQQVSLTVGLGFTVSTQGTLSACNGSEVQLSAVAPLAPATVQWQPATGLSATNILNPVLKVTSSTSYVVTIQDGMGCTASDTLVISAKTSPLTNIIQPTSQATYVFTQGQSVTLRANGATAYAWSPATGLNQATGATVVATPSATTTYRVTGSYNNGCSRTDSITLLMTTGVDQALAHLAAVQPLSPNPATGAVTLGAEVFTPAQVRISLHDLAGKELGMLFEGSVQGQFSREVALAAWPSGIYLIVWNVNGQDVHQKLQIR